MQIARRSLKMRAKNYSRLAESKAGLIADKEVLRILFYTGKDNLITDLYEHTYTTPDIYDYFTETLGLDDLKVFKQHIEKYEFQASKTAIRSIIEQNEILSEDEAYAMLYCMSQHIDAILDDPRKANIFQSHSVHVLRLSEILYSAAITKKQEGA